MEHNAELYDTIALQAKIETYDQSVDLDLESVQIIPSIDRMQALQDALDRSFDHSIQWDNARQCAIKIWHTTT